MFGILLPVQTLVLMAGMVYLSDGFSVGSPEYDSLTWIVSSLVVIAILVFLFFVSFEVFRAIKFAQVHQRARLAEMHRLEVEMMSSVMARQAATRARLREHERSELVLASPTTGPVTGSNSPSRLSPGRRTRNGESSVTNELQDSVPYYSESQAGRATHET